MKVEWTSRLFLGWGYRYWFCHGGGEKMIIRTASLVLFCALSCLLPRTYCNCVVTQHLWFSLFLFIFVLMYILWSIEGEISFYHLYAFPTKKGTIRRGSQPLESRRLEACYGHLAQNLCGRPNSTIISLLLLLKSQSWVWRYAILLRCFLEEYSWAILM